MHNRELVQLARWLQEAKHAVALTGAGVSTESGVPDFRSPGTGLWNLVDPLEVASVRGLQEDPVRFYQFWTWRFAAMKDAEPNITHRLLAALEAEGRLHAVITQNIDDLHRRAGSQRVYEVHGNYSRGRCLDCHKPYPIEQVLNGLSESGTPKCEICGGLLKPDVVLFGEILPAGFSQGQAEVAQSDLLLVLGSSLEVYPVADLVPQAKHVGARVVIVNRDPTPFDELADLVLHTDLGPVACRLRELLGHQGVPTA